MRDFEVIALTMAGLCESSVAIAASRAGHLGILDLHTASTAAAQTELARLVRFANGPVGIRLDTTNRGSAISEASLCKIFYFRPIAATLPPERPEERVLEAFAVQTS